MLDRFAALLDSRDRFLLTAHENPDGDAIGALVGLAHYLRNCGKAVRIVISPELPEYLRFLDTEGWVEVFGDAHADLAAWPETWLLVDASEPQRLGQMLGAFLASNAMKVCLDHHLTENPMGFDHAFVDSSASASAELVYDLASSRMALPMPMAQALYAGMADDTGNFRFSNATPRIHRFAAELIEVGVDPAATYQALYHQGRPERLKLFGRAFESMRFLDQGRYATTLVTQADMDACLAVKEDMEGLVNKALEIRGVEVSCLMYELPDGHYKVGLRSRGRVNVNAVCRQLGGGGTNLLPGPRWTDPQKQPKLEWTPWWCPRSHLTSPPPDVFPCFCGISLFSSVIQLPLTLLSYPMTTSSRRIPPMSPKDRSTAPKLSLDPDSPLEVVTKFETEAVPFVAKAKIPSMFGKFTVYGFLEKLTGKEHIAIVSGEIDARKRIPVRIHSECWTGDVMGSLRCDCRAQLEGALRYIAEHGGIVLYMRQEGRGIGLLNKLKAYALQEKGHDTVEANHLLGFEDDLRSYTAAVEMLRFFGITKVKLLTNNPRKVQSLEDAGIYVQRESHQLGSNPHNLFYLKTKAQKSGHMLDFLEDPEL